MSDVQEKLKQELRKVAEGYLSRLEESVRDVESAWAQVQAGPDVPEAMRHLRHLAHKLAGSGAIFGFPAVSGAARSIEMTLDGVLARGDEMTAEERSEVVRLLGDLKQAAKAAAQGPADGGAPAWAQPQQEQTKPEQAPAAEVPKTSGTPSRRGKPTLFVIDDDADTGQVLSLQLSAQGYEVRVFTELEGIEDKVARSKPAAIIMDISFPESSLAGTDAVADLQRGRSTPIPVIFVSARKDLETHLEAVRAGGHGYFTKPVDVAALAEKLEVLINHPAADLDAFRLQFEREVAAMPLKLLQQACVERGWLTPEQFEQAAGQQSDARMVADTLSQRGWLTGAQRQEALSAVFESQMGARRKGAVGEICLEKGWITQAQLDQARSRQTEAGLRPSATVLDVLVMEGAITPQQRAEAQGIAWGIPYVDLHAMVANTDVVRGLLATLKPDVCRRLKVVPFQRTRHRVRVAMQNPLDIFAQDEVSVLFGRGLAVELAIAAEEDILSVLDEVSRLGGGGVLPMLDQILVQAGGQPEVTVQEDKLEEIVDTQTLRDLSGHAPVIALCNGVILRGIEEKASDIHLQPGKEGMVMRLRLDGVLRDVLRIPRELQPAVTSRFKLMAELDIANRLVPQDGRVTLTVHGKPYDLRVSSLPSLWGEEIVMRILDKGSAQVGLEKLGMAPDMQERFERMITAAHGLILITGPTGSGKSTTLYSALHRLNAREKKIVTVEDPVEYQLSGLSQVQVNPSSGLTFAAALKAFLRQDPDIMMVGEVRETEVARIAMEAALTGHLVLSTLHTNDAPTAITRLSDMGIEPFLISSTLLGVLAQRLVRRICDRCKEAYTPDTEAMQRIGLMADWGDDVAFYRGKGCAACGNTGYRGRTGVHELLIANDTVRGLVNKGAPAYEIRALARSQGMRTLQEDGALKIKLGLTTVEEILRVLASV